MDMTRIEKLADELKMEIEAQVRGEVAARILGVETAPTPSPYVEEAREQRTVTIHDMRHAKPQPARAAAKKKLGTLVLVAAKKKPVVENAGGATRYGLDADAILGAIKQAGEGGARAEELRKQFGGSQGAFARQLAKLLKTKKIKKTGKLRATRYFAK